MSTVGGLAIAPEPSLRRRVGISARPVDLEGLVFFNSFPTNSSLIEDLLKTWRALGERPGHEASSDFCDYGAEVMCKTPCDLPRLMSKASGSFQTTYISTSFPGFSPTRPREQREPWERGCLYLSTLYWLKWQIAVTSRVWWSPLCSHQSGLNS